MSDTPKPLDGIKVVELATFMVAGTCCRFLRDLGADVVKIEAPGGDPLRYTSGSEGRPAGHVENTTFDMDNAGKKSIALNLKSDAGREILFKLLDEADVFVSNWRTDALARAGLDYDTLSQRYPALVYGHTTGFGYEGPDADLPGYDFTAFFARGGLTGSLYEKGTVPMNIVPGLGDHQVAMFLAAGVLAALYQAKQTGKGEFVSSSLFQSSIYVQEAPLVASQFGEVHYPIHRRDTVNPLLLSYKSKDDRFVQFCAPYFPPIMPKVLTAIGRDDLLGDPAVVDIEVVKTNPGPVYDMLWAEIGKRDLQEWVKVFTAADIPFAVVQTWDEVIVDEQAWANDYFYSMTYENGATRTLVRPPVSFRNMGVPEYLRGPYLGEDTERVLRDLGYSDEAIAALRAEKIAVTWDDVQAARR